MKLYCIDIQRITYMSYNICQIFYQGQCENTFSMSAERITTLDVAKIENNSQMNNHSFGVLPI